MNERLFLFTIGPVQNFIAQARRVIDFKNGSKLLSHLIDKLIEEFERSIGNDNQFYTSFNVIYPSEEIKSKPNRFVAKIRFKGENETEINENINALGTHLIKYVIELMQESFKDVLREIIDISNRGEIDSKTQEQFKEQINKFLEYYWVSLPITSEKKYTKQYSDLENWIGAIKNKRIIKQFRRGGESGVKCDLCGERNALIFYKNKKVFASNHAILINMFRKQFMSEKEGLCGVCMVKRFSTFENNLKDPYPPMNSTAGISIGHLLKDNRFEQKFKDYIQIFGNSFDEDYYFKSELENIDKTDEEMQKIKEKAENWFKTNSKMFEDSIWSKYYAFLLFDGDDIGKWISGTFMQDKLKLEEFHSKMSQRLGSYANEVEKTFEKHNGLLVYAGGDDICGFINLSNLWDLLKEIRQNFPDFRELLSDSSEIKYISTASCGVCIAHYKEPLKRVIEITRTLEHKAKEIDNKNALSIGILKPSGSFIQSTNKWYLTLSKNKYLITDLAKCIINDLKNKIYSSTFIKSLKSEFWWNERNNKIFNENEMQIQNLIMTELKRLLYRSVLMNKKINKIKEEELRDNNHRINNKILASLGEIINNRNFSNLCSFLNICDFIKSKYLTYQQIMRGG
ncbi:MAG: type III-B CRISPR-associated protein Cas10/Cmr2 [Candidatus Lokiarchaeota archaeon]|nr:type III-B CRISPR-associated protein Cas10/Cmr2 [Candidatus Lokiarchaeota archaeon]